MIIALLSLSYWVGTEANQVEAIGRDMRALQAQVIILQTSGVSSDIAVLKAHDESQEKVMTEMKEYWNARLDRIERKLDRR
jgi:predicted RND superfamily exporter protein